MKSKNARLRQEVNSIILDKYTDLNYDNLKQVHKQNTIIGNKQIPFTLMCKSTEHLNFWSAMKQCEANLEDKTKAALVVKKNRSKTYVTIELDEFIDLIRYYYGED